MLVDLGVGKMRLMTTIQPNTVDWMVMILQIVDTSTRGPSIE